MCGYDSGRYIVEVNLWNGGYGPVFTVQANGELRIRHIDWFDITAHVRAKKLRWARHVLSTEQGIIVKEVGEQRKPKGTLSDMAKTKTVQGFWSKLRIWIWEWYKRQIKNDSCLLMLDIIVQHKNLVLILIFYYNYCDYR